MELHINHCYAPVAVEGRGAANAHKTCTQTGMFPRVLCPYVEGPRTLLKLATHYLP